MSDHVTVRIPASTPHVALIRATASALGALLDFSYDRLMDLHIAIDEVCSRIMATAAPAPAWVEVEFAIDGGDLALSARGETPLAPDAEFLTTWSRAILESVTKEISVAVPDGIVLATFRVAKE